MRHAAMVPKGYLRFQLLKKLSDRSMSGSEIMRELETETNGYWKPSPGSIYPLLAWLQDQNLIREAEQTEPGIRRYALTEQGKEALQAETKSREEIRRHLENLRGGGEMWYGLHSLGEGEMGKAARGLFRAARDLHHELKQEHSKEELEEAKQAMADVTKEIQEITRKLHA